MANIILITGPQAVGKMTVGEALKEKIGYNLMVNHDTIEVSDKIFGFATPTQKKLNWKMREAVFDICTEFNESLIFTVMIDFNEQYEWDYVLELQERFENSGGELYLAELYADVDTRLERNSSPHRLEMKKSKNDVEWSNKNLKESMLKHRLNSNDGEYMVPNHIKIDNTNLSPEEVADIIINKFNLEAEYKEIPEHGNKMY